MDWLIFCLLYLVEVIFVLLIKQTNVLRLDIGYNFLKQQCSQLFSVFETSYLNLHILAE